LETLNTVIGAFYVFHFRLMNPRAMVHYNISGTYKHMLVSLASRVFQVLFDVIPFVVSFQSNC
jgi:hypothetical protein